MLPYRWALNEVGVTGFEPAATRPPDVYSNRAELHPENTKIQNTKSTKNTVSLTHHTAKSTLPTYLISSALENSLPLPTTTLPTSCPHIKPQLK